MSLNPMETLEALAIANLASTTDAIAATETPDAVASAFKADAATQNYSQVLGDIDASNKFNSNRGTRTKEALFPHIGSIHLVEEATTHEPNTQKGVTAPKSTYPRPITHITVPAMATSLKAAHHKSTGTSTEAKERLVRQQRSRKVKKRKYRDNSCSKHRSKVPSAARDAELLEDNNRYAVEVPRATHATVSHPVASVVDRNDTEDVLDESETPIGRMLRHKEQLLEHYSRLFTTEKRYHGM